MVAELEPEPEHEPLVVIATESPDVEVATTGKLVPYVAVAGAVVVTEIVWLSLFTVIVSKQLLFTSLTSAVELVGSAVQTPNDLGLTNEVPPTPETGMLTSKKLLIGIPSFDAPDPEAHDSDDVTIEHVTVPVVPETATVGAP